MTSSIGGRGGISQIMTVDDRGEGGLAKLWRYEVKVMTGSLHKGGGGVSQIMTVDDRGEGGVWLI